MPPSSWQGKWANTSPTRYSLDGLFPGHAQWAALTATALPNDGFVAPVQGFETPVLTYPRSSNIQRPMMFTSTLFPRF